MKIKTLSDAKAFLEKKWDCIRIPLKINGKTYGGFSSQYNGICIIEKTSDGIRFYCYGSGWEDKSPTYLKWEEAIKFLYKVRKGINNA